MAVAINAGTVASKTYDLSPGFPAANTADSLGTLTNTYAAAGDVLTLAVTNGTTANGVHDRLCGQFFAVPTDCSGSWASVVEALGPVVLAEIRGADL